MRRLLALVCLVALVQSVGCASSGAYRIGSSDKKTEWVGGIGTETGRLEIRVMIMDGEGSPVTNEKVTLLTNRNETFVQYSSVDSAIIATHDSNAKGSQLASRASTLGTAVFGGVRGGLHSVVIFVRGRPFNFSNADLLKGWDRENNLINLIVTFYGVTSSELSRAVPSPVLQPANASEVETRVHKLRTLQASYIQAEQAKDSAGMALYGSEMNEILAVLTGSPTK